MKYNNFLYNISINSITYNNYLSHIDNILQKYHAKDKIHLVSEYKSLKEKLEKIDNILINLMRFTEEVPEEIQKYFMKYFNEVKKQFRDFLIILKWNDSGAFQKELDTLIKGNSRIPSNEKENYQALLYTLNQAVK